MSCDDEASMDELFSTALAALGPGSAATTAEKENVARDVRKRLSVETDPPIDAVLQAGLAPHLVESLGAFENPRLQFEAAWALTNICSGTSEHVEALVACGALPALVDLLPRPESGSESAARAPKPGTVNDVEEQAIWALGNISGDSVRCRDQVLATSALAALVHKLKDHGAGLPISLQRTAAWALSNLCRGKPLPALASIRPALPCLADLLTSADDETAADACWALSYLVDGGAPERVREVLVAGGAQTCVVATALQAARLRLDVARLSHGRIGSLSPFPDALDVEVLAHISAHIGVGQVAPRLAALLNHRPPNVQSAAIAVVAHIAAGAKAHQIVVMDCIGWGGLCRLLGSRKEVIKKEACKVVSCIVSGSNAQLQSAIEYGIVVELVKLASEGAQPAAAAAAARVLISVVTHATDEQIARHFVQEGQPKVGHLCFAVLCVRCEQKNRRGAEPGRAGLTEALSAVSRLLSTTAQQRSKDLGTGVTTQNALPAKSEDRSGVALLPALPAQVDSDEFFAVAGSLEELVTSESCLEEDMERAEQLLERYFLEPSGVVVAPASTLSGAGDCGPQRTLSAERTANFSSDSD